MKQLKVIIFLFFIKTDVIIFVISGLCDQFSLKIINEHQLPVATRQLRTTNECIAAALNSVSKYVGELCRTFRERESLALLCIEELKQRRPEWSAWRRRAIDYYRSINEVSYLFFLEEKHCKILYFSDSSG